MKTSRLLSYEAGMALGDTSGAAMDETLKLAARYVGLTRGGAVPSVVTLSLASFSFAGYSGTLAPGGGAVFLVNGMYRRDDVPSSFVELTATAKPFAVPAFLKQCGVREPRVFVNLAEHRTVVTGSHLWEEEGRMPMLASLLYTFLPWIYPDPSSLTEQDKRLFTYLNQNKIDEFIDETNELCEKTDFNHILFSTKLKDFGDVQRFKRINALEEGLKAEYVSLEKAEKEVDSLLASIAVDNLCLAAMKNAEAGEDSARLEQFFKERPCLSLGPVGNTNFRFYITTYLSSWDKDVFVRDVYNNHRSYLYYNTGSDYDKARAVFNELFNKETAKIRVTSEFELEGGFVSLTPVKNIYLPGDFSNTSSPHPHLCQFGCLGENKRYITDYLKTGDWDMAIDQAIAATMNIAWGDSTVCEWFLRHMKLSLWNDVKCIVMDGHDDMTPAEFYELIKDNYKEEV